MADKDFVNSYLKDFSSLLKPNDELTAMLVDLIDPLRIPNI